MSKLWKDVVHFTQKLWETEANDCGAIGLTSVYAGGLPIKLVGGPLTWPGAAPKDNILLKGSIGAG